MKTTPYKHQQDIFDRTWDKKYFALFMDQGTGKTKITIDTFDELVVEGKTNCMIVVAPNGVQSNWVNTEIPKHGACMTYGKHVWRGLTTKKEKQELVALKKSVNIGPIVLAVNIEALRLQRCADVIADFLVSFPCLMVVDESTTIKNPLAKQTKAAIALGKLAKYRRILTGTPLAQSPLDAYSQMKFLKDDFWPHGSWTAFRSDFAVEQLETTAGNRKYVKVVGYRNQDKLQSILAPHSVRVTKGECLDLPEKIFMRREVELTTEQARAYKDMTDLAMTQIRDGLVTASNALSLLSKFHRITLGHIVTDEGQEYELHTNRLNVVRDIVEELPKDEQIIIWAHFKIDIRRIARFIIEDMKQSCVTYYGDVSRGDRELAQSKFSSGGARFFIANKAASRGLTLTAASTVIYYSNDYSLETRLQSEDRCHRIGQTKHVVYHDLVCPGTVDQRIVEALKSKQDLSAEIMKGITKIEDLI